MGQAVELRQALDATDPKTYRTGLANSLYVLGYYRSKLGDWKGVIDTVGQAVTLHQALSAADSKTYDLKVAYSLYNTTIYHSEIKD